MKFIDFVSTNTPRRTLRACRKVIYYPPGARREVCVETKSLNFIETHLKSLNGGAVQ